MSNYSLHFGINQYNPDYYGEGNDLDKCVQDAFTMAGIAEHFGFDRRIITDDEATRARWLAEVNELAYQARRGDTVFLTQSSHGTYQDEYFKRSTGICMNDAVLWDFEIREVLQKFHSGVLVVWLTDCCFSESNWRMARPLVPAHVRTRFLRLPQKFEIKPTNGDKRKFPSIFFAYSAANAFQLAFEDARGGAFTQAVDQALKLEKSLSYFQLYRRASEILAKEYPQSPVLDTIRAADYTGSPFLSHYKTEKT